ncbi:unnamed protein product [Pedinophyceae sp. YPF-701]|nr:unnamed protein product [Pedinophyceae sp. YPF-701]
MAASRASRSGLGGGDQEGIPQKVAAILGLVLLSRLGVYVPVPGVDTEAFSEALKQGAGALGYVDALTGGSISRVSIFSLGIIPYINASIVFQLMASVIPSLKQLQREEGPQGRAKFKLYQKLAALAFAFLQAFGQLNYCRPFVDDFSTQWLLENSFVLAAGAMCLTFIADEIDKKKLGNGTSILIFANIVSALPSSLGSTLAQVQERGDYGSLGVFGGAFLLTCLGIVYVQEAERKIPINYANRFKAGALARSAYLPFKVNATGVMPVIFSTSLLALPATLSRFTTVPALQEFAAAMSPAGSLYVPANVFFIVLFNYFYTFLQFEPKDVADNLKKQGASLAGVRPGRQTADFITDTLARMSVLGSVFLGVLASAPAVVEAFTDLQAFRGFAGTSVLILVGVATDSARKVRAEKIMEQYRDVEDFYSGGGGSRSS